MVDTFPLKVKASENDVVKVKAVSADEIPVNGIVVLETGAAALPNATNTGSILGVAMEASPSGSVADIMVRTEGQVELDLNSATAVLVGQIIYTIASSGTTVGTVSTNQAIVGKVAREHGSAETRTAITLNSVISN